ncbi:MAG: PQQ-binding-like beta-propeller repeat protein [candidate division WOR-3 bacterium]
MKNLPPIILFAGLLFMVCGRNKNPGVPSITGPTEVFVGEEDTFFVSAVDPDEDSLSYLIDWGDGNFTRWSDYYASGDTGSFTHRFATESLYYLKAIAKDLNGDTSDWSSLLAIEVLSELQLKWLFTASGVELWSEPPAIGYDGTIYVVLEWRLYALDPFGNQKWSYYVADFPITSPAIGADGTIYVGVGSGEFVALNTDGSIKWSYPAPSPTGGAIGIDGTIYFGSGDSCLYALNPDGTLKWRYKADAKVNATPIINSNGNIHFPAGDGYYYAVSPGGDLIWKTKITSDASWWHTAGAISSDGTIFTIPNGQGIYAIKSDGSIKWHLPIEVDFPSINSPVIGPDGTIYIAGKDSLFAISQNGSIIWTHQGESSGTPMVISDGSIIVPMQSEIYLFSNKGRARSKTKITCRYSRSYIGYAPTIDNNGTIYDIGYKELVTTLFAIQGRDSLALSSWPMYQHDPQHTGRVD